MSNTHNHDVAIIAAHIAVATTYLLNAWAQSAEAHRMGPEVGKIVDRMHDDGPVPAALGVFVLAALLERTGVATFAEISERIEAVRGDDPVLKSALTSTWRQAVSLLDSDLWSQLAPPAHCMPEPPTRM